MTAKRQGPVSDVRFDPVTLSLLWTRLIGIVDEAAITLVRTSFSPVVQECNDYSCTLMDARGYALADNTSSIPAFLGTLPRTVRHILAKFPVEIWVPGDVVITNNPWMGTGHLPDFSMVAPIFHRDRLYGFAGTVAHSVDIGGLSWASHAQSVFEEGLHLPIVHLMRAGRPDEQLLDIIRQNVRFPELVVGDLMAQVAACETCIDCTREFIDDTDLDGLDGLANEVQGHAEATMRAAIAAIPDGRYETSIILDGFDAPLTLRARLTVNGARLHMDYDGSSPQVSWGINSVLNYTYAYTAYPLKCALDPLTPKNEGTYRPIEVTAPEGSIVNPLFPAPCSGRHLVGMYCAAAAYATLGQAAPERVIAESSGPPARPVIVGAGDDGDLRSLIIFAWGGTGGRPGMDGLSCTAFPGNDNCAPVEIMEAAVPIRFIRKSLIPDSGGAGEFRGGLGQDITFAYTGRQSGYVTMMSAKFNTPPSGIFGGAPGTTTEFLINDRPAYQNGRVPLQPGDIVTIRFPGGGGYGDPARRHPDRVARDVADGKATAARATALYGPAWRNAGLRAAP